MTETNLRQLVVSLIAAGVGSVRGDAWHKQMLATYNAYKPLPRGHKMLESEHYCAATVSAAWIKAGVDSVAVIECSCSKMVELAKQRGIWIEDDAFVPRPGDAVIYDWQDDGKGDNKGVPDHIGIVERVDGNAMTIIEGNRPVGHVARHQLAVNGRYIRGFICPKFSSLATPEKSVTDIAREVIAGKWGNGAERKRRLTEAGYDYDAVQAEVNRLLKGDKPPKPIPAKSFSISVAHKYTTKTELTLRYGPGTGYQAVKTLPKGTKVRCYGFYSKVSGVRWLYVQTNVGVGYVDERLLTR